MLCGIDVCRDTGRTELPTRVIVSVILCDTITLFEGTSTILGGVSAPQRVTTILFEEGRGYRNPETVTKLNKAETRHFIHANSGKLIWFQ